MFEDGSLEIKFSKPNYGPHPIQVQVTLQQAKPDPNANQTKQAVASGQSQMKKMKQYIK